MVSSLDADDLELAVTTAYLGGRVAEALAALQRAEQVLAAKGERRRAARNGPGSWSVPATLPLGRDEVAASCA